MEKLKFQKINTMELQPIQSKIIQIRGVYVILDFDLAEMYQVATRVLNQSVKRNIKRFPSDFMFQLTFEEWDNLKSQFVTSSWGGTRKMPYAFTEQGIAMLSGLLNSDIAIEINIGIMRSFVAIRKMLLTNPNDEVKELQNEVKELKQYIEEVFTDYNDINEETRMQLELINETLAELHSKDSQLKKERPQIGYTADRYRKNEHKE